MTAINLMRNGLVSKFLEPNYYQNVVRTYLACSLARQSNIIELPSLSPRLHALNIWEEPGNLTSNIVHHFAIATSLTVITFKSA